MSRMNDDRRREERQTASGEVSLLLEDPEPLLIQGRLSDWSANGFRAAHDRTSLCAGQEVRFRHATAQGRARVVWNRILAEHVESGFLVLDKSALDRRIPK